MGDFQVSRELVFVEIDDQDRGGSADFFNQPQLFERRQQPVKAEGRADAGELLFGEQTGQVVVPASGADAADGGEVGEKGFKDRAGVIVQAAGDGDVDL